MFTKKQQKALDKLKKLLKETPEKVIKRDIEKITKISCEGPDLDQFLENPYGK
jgi:hypothetical protein